MSKRVLITLCLDYDECIEIKKAFTEIHHNRSCAVDRLFKNGITPPKEQLDEVKETLEQHDSLMRQTIEAFKLNPK